MDLEDDYLLSFLRAHVDGEGNTYLQSQYSSEKGLYHTKVELLIDGEEEIISERIRALDKRNQRDNVQGRIIEKISFKEASDNGILEAIATHSKKNIRVRFTAGGSYFEDVVLLQRHKNAIRDTWLLSLYLQNHGALTTTIKGNQ